MPQKYTELLHTVALIFQNMSIQHKRKFFNYLLVLPFLQGLKKMKQYILHYFI